jgi:hypothetical protein
MVVSSPEKFSACATTEVTCRSAGWFATFDATERALFELLISAMLLNASERTTR